MSSRFETIQPGDQLEMPARKMWHSMMNDTRNPERPVRVAVVTHRWHDPVERKDYVALAYILQGGATTEPKEKRTIRGLAQAGWKPATKDWIAWAQAVQSSPEVVPLFQGKRK